MENRVGLNLLYAQVSLELPQNPSPELVSHSAEKTPFMFLLPIQGEVPSILLGHLAQPVLSLLCKLIGQEDSLQRAGSDVGLGVRLDRGNWTLSLDL